MGLGNLVKGTQLTSDAKLLLGATKSGGDLFPAI